MQQTLVIQTNMEETKSKYHYLPGKYYVYSSDYTFRRFNKAIGILRNREINKPKHGPNFNLWHVQINMNSLISLMKFRIIVVTYKFHHLVKIKHVIPGQRYTYYETIERYDPNFYVNNVNRFNFDALSPSIKERESVVAWKDLSCYVSHDFNYSGISVIGSK